MKKGFRIAAWIAGILLLLLLCGFVTLQSPAVQTALARRVVNAFSDRFDGDIQVGNVVFRPFDAVVLEDVLLTDGQPHTDGRFPPLDTVAHVGSLSVRFSMKSLLNKERIYLSRVRLEDGTFNLVIEPGEDGGKNKINLMRVLRIPPSDPDKPKKEFGDLLEAGRVEARNFTFRMVNYPGAARQEAKGTPEVPDTVIDWNDLELKADLLVTDLLVKDGDILGNANHILLKEKSGLDVGDLSGKVRVGHGQVILDNLHYRDRYSDLYLRYLHLLGTLDDDYPDFINRVRIEGEILEPSVLSMRSISSYAPKLDNFTFCADLSGKVEGPVSDLNLKGITFHDRAGDVQGKADLWLRGLPDTGATRLDGAVKDFRFDLDGLGTFIREWAPKANLDLGKYGKGTDFRVNATVKGLLNNLSVKGDVQSNAGSADLDIFLKDVANARRPIAIGGNIRTNNLDAGRIAGIKALGPVTLNTSLEAVFKPKNPQVQIDTLTIGRLHALGYDYSGIAAVGSYADQSFDGRIICDDPNLNFLLQGRFDLSQNTRNTAYQFYANIGYADLNALHLDKRGASKVSFQTDANFVRTREGDLLGDINVRNLMLENDTGLHPVGDITASSHANDNIYRIRLNSSFAEGTFVGDRSPVSMLSDLQELVVRKDLPALLSKKGKPWDGSVYELHFKFFDSQELLAFVLPGLYIEKNTRLDLTVDKDGRVDGDLVSGRLALGDKFLKDIRLNVNNLDDALRADISGGIIHMGGLELLDNRLAVLADDDRFGLSYTFDNRTDAARKADIRLDGALSREDGDLLFTVNAQPSRIYYEGDCWDLDSDDISLRNGSVRIDRFRLSNGPQSLLVDGGLSPQRADTLNFRMEQFDIAMANAFLMDGKFDLRGKATGRARLVSPYKPTPSLLAGILCDSTYLAGRPVGRLQVGSVWNDEEQRFDFRLNNLLNDVRNLDLEGYLRPTDKAVSADLKMDRLDLAYAAPILKTIFHRFEGGLNGKIHVGGTLNDLRFSSEGMEIKDAILGIDYTQVAYNVSGPVSLDTEGLHFLDVGLTDGAGGKGTVTGGLLFGGFKDMRLDTHVQFDQMKVLGITGHDGPIYGEAYGTGRLDITGPFQALLLNVDARTVKNGNLHIPLKSGGTKATGELLVFKEPFREAEEDPYEQMMAANRTEKTKLKSELEVRLRVRATPAVAAYIDLGENALRALGNGLIDLRYLQSQNLFTLNGDYTLTQGDFHFTALNMVTRDFTIREGSRIRFNGDVMDSDLNVTGVYTTKADINTLLTGSYADPTGTRRQVDCIIGITDKLRNPQLTFEIDIPELDPATQGLVQSALNTEDKVMKQFLYLLIANSFLPNEESGIISNGSSSVLFSNVTGIMAGQLNSIFERLNIPLDLGLNYQQSRSGQNIFDVAVSTQLFNNRVIVNGTIGNRRLFGTATEEVTGDLDIDIKLDKAGTFRLNLFSHSADQYTSFLDNSQRNGVGIAYQREFDNFRQFFRDLFSTRAQREERAAWEALHPAPRKTLQIDSTGKAHVLVPQEPDNE